MKNKKNKEISQIVSKAKRLLINCLFYPYKTEVLEMILTFVDFIGYILTEFG